MSYYDDIASGYNQLHELEQQEKLRHLKSLIKERIILSKGMTVLDVGCGSGVSSDFWVKEFGCVVTGIDPSAGLIKQNKAGLSKFHLASAESLPFPDASFDLVISLTAIQNFTDVRKGLEEMRRVGKKTFILTTLKKAPNHESITRDIHTVFRVHFETTITKDAVFLVY